MNECGWCVSCVCVSLYLRVVRVRVVRVRSRYVFLGRCAAASLCVVCKKTAVPPSGSVCSISSC